MVDDELTARRRVNLRRIADEVRWSRCCCQEDSKERPTNKQYAQRHQVLWLKDRS